MERIINNLEKLPVSYTGHLTIEHINIVKSVCNLVNPKTMLEFGFNVGHSAIFWLENSNTVLTSYDPSDSRETLQGAEVVKDLYDERFIFKNVSSATAKFDHSIKSIDLVFVDGDHSSQGCFRDLTTSAYLNVPYILVDDYNDIGEVKSATQKFLQEFPYTIAKVYSIENTSCVLALLRRE